jgi:hypothetical protein
MPQIYEYIYTYGAGWSTDNGLDLYLRVLGSNFVRVENISSIIAVLFCCRGNMLVRGAIT